MLELVHTQAFYYMSVYKVKFITLKMSVKHVENVCQNTAKHVENV